MQNHHINQNRAIFQKFQILLQNWSINNINGVIWVRLQSLRILITQQTLSISTRNISPQIYFGHSLLYFLFFSFPVRLTQHKIILLINNFKWTDIKYYNRWERIPSTPWWKQKISKQANKSASNKWKRNSIVGQIQWNWKK